MNENSFHSPADAPPGRYINGTTGDGVEIPARSFGDNDALLRQHCVELAIQRLNAMDAADIDYDDGADATAKKYYDFIKGNGPGDGAPQPPMDPHCTHDPQAIPRPNSFEANVEPAKATPLNLELDVPLSAGHALAMFREHAPWGVKWATFTLHFDFTNGTRDVKVNFTDGNSGYHSFKK